MQIFLRIFFEFRNPFSNFFFNIKLYVCLAVSNLKLQSAFSFYKWYHCAHHPMINIRACRHKTCVKLQFSYNLCSKCPTPKTAFRRVSGTQGSRNTIANINPDTAQSVFSGICPTDPINLYPNLYLSFKKVIQDASRLLTKKQFTLTHRNQSRVLSQLRFDIYVTS